jgi:hypothetical protein
MTTGNMRLVYIVWVLGEDNYGGSQWYPATACCDENEACEYISEREDDYDVQMMYTSAYVDAPLKEEA